MLKYLKAGSVKYNPWGRSLALGLLLGGVLNLFGPEPQISRARLKLIHQGLTWGSSKQAAFIAILCFILVLIVLIPKCSRKTFSDKIFWIFTIVVTIVLMSCSVAQFLADKRLFGR